jgi:hypothetical protein
MFCDGCGTALQPGQLFCARCGKQVVGPVAAVHPPIPAPGRVQTHIHLVGILWMAVSALTAVAGVFLCILGTALFPHLRELGAAPPDVPTGFLSSLFNAIGIAILVKAGCGFLAGWGLMRRESWARILALVLSFISLVNIPFGTAIAVYTLWVLLPGESQREYDVMVAGPPV